MRTTSDPEPLNRRVLPHGSYAGPFAIERQLGRLSIRQACSQFLSGFLVFVHAIQLITHSLPLARLTAAAAISYIACAWFLLDVIKGIMGERWGDFGASLPFAVHVLLTLISIVIVALAFPVFGPIATAIRIRAAVLTHALARRDEAEPWSLMTWMEVISDQFLHSYGRFFLYSIAVSVITSIVGALIPGGASPEQFMVQAVVTLIALGLFTLVSLERSRGDVLELVRGRWPAIVGYVVGLACFTLLGLAPWFTTLVAVAAELFVFRIDPPALSQISQASTPQKLFERFDSGYARFDPKFVGRVQRSYARLGENLRWTHVAPETANTRLEIIPLMMNQPTEEKVVALVPTDKLGRVHPEITRHFWVLRTMYVGYISYRNLPLGDYAGPFPIVE